MSFQPGIRTRRRSAAALGFLGPIALLFLASASVQLRSAFLLPATGEAAANTGGGEYDGYADSPRRMRRREGGDGEADDEDDDEGDQGGRGVTTTMRASPSTGQIADARRRRRLPRIVVVEYPDGSNGTQSVRPLLPIDGVGYDENRSSSFEFATDSIPTNCPGEVCALVTPSWHEPNALDYIDEDTDACEPMADWQLGAYPNCNSFHEVDMRRLRVINSGGSRTAFEMAGVSADGTGMKFVYKTIKFRKDVTASKIDEQRKDSLIMERTTKSMFIPDIHGYCSLAVMMDFMPEGNMHEYIKGARLVGGSALPPVDRLRLSIHIATSVADLHTIDGTPMPSFFHNDLCCHQYLFQNGVFKLNDFNYARPIYVNKKTKEQCKRINFGMQMWKARSLEEHRIMVRDKTFKGVNPDKVDVWMMGNLIYYMLTDIYTFEKPTNLSWKASGRELLAGRRSPLPKHISESTDPSHVAVRKALDMCWTQNWKERPSARSVSDYLISRLREITGDENPDLRVVLPERDPNMKGTDSEYEKYNN